MISTRLINLLALAVSLPLIESATLDDWAPPIIYPNVDTVWKIGQLVNVTWDISNPPSSLTNPTGNIYLVVNSIIQFDPPLASDFSMMDGIVVFPAPEISVGSYQVDLFGNSGNDSPLFNIVW